MEVPDAQRVLYDRLHALAGTRGEVTVRAGANSDQFQAGLTRDGQTLWSGVGSANRLVFSLAEWLHGHPGR
jgi:hypothetical protein